MKAKMILSAIGSDRPGLTQALADAVYDAGGNWLESHLSRLGGKYVGAVLVEIEAGRQSALEDAVAAIDAEGLRVAVLPAGDAVALAGETLAIELVGQDRPGIVREVSRVLAALGVNIDDFTTATEHGSWSGEPLFRAAATLALPAGLSSQAVREALEAISGEIMVDFTIS